MKIGGQLHLSVNCDKYFTRYGSVCVLETKNLNPPNTWGTNFTHLKIRFATLLSSQHTSH